MRGLKLPLRGGRSWSH